MSLDRKISIASARILQPLHRQRLEESGHIVHEHDLLHIQLLDIPTADIFGSADPLVITSLHAARALLQSLGARTSAISERTIYAIKGRTSHTLIEAGCTELREAVSGKCLAENIIAADEKEVTYLTTSDRLDLLESLLADAKITTRIHHVYSKSKVAHTYPRADAILCFSPSQIDAYLLQNSIADHQVLVCIGETTATHARSLGIQNILIADQSSESSVVDAVIKHYSS